MRRSILAVFILAALNADAQKIMFYDWQWLPCQESKARFVSVIKQTDSGWLRNDIYLATKKLQKECLYKDSNCNIPNGLFTTYYVNQKISMVGRYVDGKRNGPWISYHYNGMIKDSSFYIQDSITWPQLHWHANGYLSDSFTITKDGYLLHAEWFDNGKPSSVCKFSVDPYENKQWYYHRNGNIAAREMYKGNKLISRIYYDEEGMQISDTADRDRTPLFRGKKDKWGKYVENNLEWPKGVKLVNTDTVTVMVAATIDEKGNVTDAYVEVPFDPLFDNEVLRVVKRSPKWEPAISKNRYVKYYITEAVNFIDRRKKD